MQRTPHAGLRLVQHAQALAETLDSARSVVGARLSQDAARARGPVATALEMSRMVPEKLLAFSAGGAAVAQGSARLGQLAGGHMMAELEAAHRGMLGLARCRTPMGAAAVQAQWWMGSAMRAGQFGQAWAAASMSMAEAALRPVQRTVDGNLRRLG